MAQEALILTLVDHQVAILHIEGNFGTLASNGVGESLTDVQIHGVAEFVGARDAAGFDAGGKIASARDGRSCCVRASPEDL